MSWHWIIDDPTLGPMEKLTLLTIRRQQYGDAAVMLQQETIAQKAGISLRAAQSALSAAEAHGCLEVTRRKNHASSYRVVQRQGLLFSNANFHQVLSPGSTYRRPGRPLLSPSSTYRRPGRPLLSPGSPFDSRTRRASGEPGRPLLSQASLRRGPDTESPRQSSIAGMERGYRGQGQAPFPHVQQNSEENSVENAVPASEVHARGAPPGLFGTQVVRTFIRKGSGNSKDKTRAEVRPRATANPADEQQRQKIEARNDRLLQEAEMLRNSMAGAGPGLEPEIARTLTRIAEKMALAEPLTQQEFERRRQEQWKKFEERRKVQ